MSDLVGTPEDRFSRVVAQIFLYLQGYNVNDKVKQWTYRLEVTEDI